MSGEWSGSSTSDRTPCASSSNDGGRQVLSQREMLHLGADVELHGSIPREKLAAAALLVGSYADAARAAGVVDLAVLITSPGRQAANGNELLAVLASAADCPTRILSAAEEAQLGFLGALAVAAPPAPSPGRGRRRRRWLGTGRGRYTAWRSGVAALDRPRLSAADQQDARRRPAGTCCDRRRARGGGPLSRRVRTAGAFPRPRRRWQRARAQADRRSDAWGARSWRRHSPCSPRCPPQRSFRGSRSTRIASAR